MTRIAAARTYSRVDRNPRSSSHRRVSLLGAVAQGEQCLLAAEPATGVGDGDDLLRGEERRVELRRRFRERAVVAVIPAEHRERNEDLAGVGHRPPVPQLTKMRGDRAQPLELDAARLQQGLCLVDRQRLSGLRARERPTLLLWGGWGHRPRAYYRADGSAHVENRASCEGIVGRHAYGSRSLEGAVTNTRTRTKCRHVMVKRRADAVR
jgi:hypothetical protein